MGIKNVLVEKEVSKMLDYVSSVKMKKRKGISEGYIDYDIVITGNVDEFIEEFRDVFDNSNFRIDDVTLSQNLVIIKIK